MVTSEANSKSKIRLLGTELNTTRLYYIVSSQLKDRRLRATDGNRKSIYVVLQFGNFIPSSEQTFVYNYYLGGE